MVTSGPPVEVGIEWPRIISERHAWVAHNFPDDQLEHSILGMVEEIGELTHHYLKYDQGIRGDDDFHMTEMADAVADCTIFALGVLDHWGYLPFIYPFETCPRSVLICQLAYDVGDLAVTYHHVPQPTHTMERVLSELNSFCGLQGWDYAQLVTSTWDSVKQRDWIKYPQDGVAK